MPCSHCGKPVPDGLALCEACRRPAGATGGLLGRLMQWLGSWFSSGRGMVSYRGQTTRSYYVLDRLPPEIRGKVLEELERSAGGNSPARQVTVSQVRQGSVPLDQIDQLPPELRQMVEEARASGQTKVQVYSETTTYDSIHGTRTVREGTPLDPQMRQQLDSLLQKEAPGPIPLEPAPSERAADATLQKQGRYIFRDVSGREHAYDSLEQMPPEVREIFRRMRPEDLPRLNIRPPESNA